MKVELFGLALLTSTQPLYKNIIFEDDGWSFSVRPTTESTWDISFCKPRQYGDRATGKLTCEIDKQAGKVVCTSFSLNEPQHRLTTVALQSGTLYVRLKDKNSDILKPRECEEIAEYYHFITALLEVKMHIEKLVMYRE